MVYPNSQFSSLARRRQGFPPRPAGFTLVEVAVALAIFVFGALVVVRVFPPAFALIQNSGSRSIATHLSRNVLNSFNQNPLQVPDAVCSALPTPVAGSNAPTGYGWADYPYSTVGGRQNSTLPADLTKVGSTPPTSAFETFLYIVGERQPVQFDNSATPSPFIMLQHPPDTSSNIYVWIEDTVSGVTIDSSGDLNFANATLASTGQTFNDTTAGFPARPPQTNPNGIVRSNTRYYVTYKWQESTSPISTSVPIQQVIDEPLVYPDDSASNVGTVRVLACSRTSPAFVQTEAGSIKVRIRELVSVPAPTPDQATVGYVSLATSAVTLTPGTVVSIDYSVSGWSWLVDDTPLSESSPQGTNYYVVNLPVRHIDYAGGNNIYTFVTGTNSNGLVYLPQTTTQTTLASIAALFPQNPTAPVVAGSNPTLYNIDYKNAQITLDSELSSSNGYGAPRVRTAYQTLDGWGTQISVAARSYVPYYGLTTDVPDPFSLNVASTQQISEQWRNYLWSSANSNFLYFHASEAGKSVLVTYLYGSAPYSTGTAVVNIGQDLFPEPAGYTTSFVQSANNGQSLVSSAEIITPDGSNVAAIQGIQGVSTQALTAFIDNNRYTDVSVMGYRPPPVQ